MDRLIAWTCVALLCVACDPSRPIYQGIDAADCPTVVDPAATYVADVQCSARRCVPTVVQDRCGLSIDLLGCDVVGVTATIDVDGSLAFDPSPDLVSCTGTALDGTLRMMCERERAPCAIILGPLQPPLEVVASWISILPAPFDAPDGSRLEPLDYRDPITGYLGGAARLSGPDSKIVVSTYDGAFRSTRCPRPLTSRLVFVDTATLDTQTSTAPDCLTMLADDPASDGFLGLYDDGGPRIGRFDRNGSLKDSAPVEVETDPNGSRPSAFFSSADAIYAAYNHTKTPLARIDINTLATATVTEEWPGMIRAIDRIGSDLVITERVDGLMVVLDPMSLARRRIVPLAHQLRPSNDAGALFYSSLNDRYYVTATGETSVLWNVEGPLDNRVAPSFAVEPTVGATIWSMTTSTIDDRLWAFGVGPAPTYDTHLLEFDERTRRFVPRRSTLGRGVITDVFEDGDIRWALSPWSGGILRIR